MIQYQQLPQTNLKKNFSFLSFTQFYIAGKKKTKVNLYGRSTSKREIQKFVNIN